MNAEIEHLDGIVSQSLSNERKTGAELRTLITTLNGALNLGVQPDDQEQLARNIEERFGISMGLGAMVDDDDFRPWLPEAKASIDPFYWGRYRKLMLKNGLPQDVVTATDTVTDEILGRLGNPNLEEEWDRRGMVVGHVQSGKTGNYTGLICKAADAGYRLIVVIAGIHNNLRNQTQERIDEGFIGRDTGRLAMKGKKEGNKAIGVGLFDNKKTPVSLTNTLTDFRKATATGNTSEIDSYKVPVVLVIKKNHSTLKNLLDWLSENSAKGDAQMISQPMLLIDDEADNASISTKYSKEEITKINGQIRDLLGMFHRSCYVGYTATPFANIFVDPDSYDEAKKEDLFPRHFIVGLDAPTNYFGPKKIFIDGLPEEGEPTWLRYISDNEDILPVKHRIDQSFEELPDSLLKALRTFLIARTIRNLRGQARSHCSMLVNASRFTNVQGKIRNRLHERLDSILDALRINGSRGSAGLGDLEIAALRQVWSEEYSSVEFDWLEIQEAMLEAVAAAKVVEVNSRANGLDYSDGATIGQTLIAVGGFSLSRGLTLEGLTVTWFLRNTMMYDTLMQMGRWFGYRGGYEDLCRIWMPIDAIDWYAHIAEATDELHQELKKMEKAKATPADFGLAVRSHPTSLMVTARNKMGSGQKHVMIGLSNAWVETAKISARPDDLARNEEAAVRFLEASRHFNISRDSVAKMMAFSVPPGYRRKAPVKRPKLDAFTGIFDGWLDGDREVHRKQRPRAKRVFERLRDEHGFTGGDTIVKDYMRQRERRGREMFVPLAHPPGHAQADFGEAVVVIGGIEQKAHFLVMDLPHSDSCFVRAYPAATAEAWVDGHVHAFAFFGKVPASVLYGNDRCLVAKILPDGTRQRATLFSGFLSHYLFRDRYGRPGKGNDKGNAEGLVGYSRRNFMVPIPRFATWGAFHDYLEAQCLKRQADVLRGQSETIAERLERDLAAMADLPTAPFDACDQVTGRVSSQALVRYKTNDYSVPVAYGHRDVWIRGYVDVVVIGCGGEVIARHSRCYDREDMVFDAVHYLPLIEQKINTLDQAAPLAEWDLPSEFATLRRLMEARMIKTGRREYVQVLRLLETFDIDDLHAAVKKALQLGAVGFDAVKHLVLCHVEKRPPKLDLDVYPYLPRANVETTSAASYMALMSEDAA